MWKSHSIPCSTKIKLMKALVWPVATYGCESWTLRKNEETRLEAFEMKGLRKILRVLWTAKQWRNRRGRTEGAVAPGRSRQGGAKQPDQKYFMTNEHKSEFDIVS